MIPPTRRPKPEGTNWAGVIGIMIFVVLVIAVCWALQAAGA